MIDRIHRHLLCELKAVKNCDNYSTGRHKRPSLANSLAILYILKLYKKKRQSCAEYKIESIKKTSPLFTEPYIAVVEPRTLPIYIYTMCFVFTHGSPLDDVIHHTSLSVFLEDTPDDRNSRAHTAVHVR